MSIWRFTIFFLYLQSNKDTNNMAKLNLSIGGPTTWSEAFADTEESQREIMAGKGTSWETIKEIMKNRLNMLSI